MLRREVCDSAAESPVAFPQITQACVSHRAGLCEATFQARAVVPGQAGRAAPGPRADGPEIRAIFLTIMFARAALRTPVSAVRAPAATRLFSQTATANRKVAVLGASGGIGQPVRTLL